MRSERAFMWLDFRDWGSSHQDEDFTQVSWQEPNLWFWHFDRRSFRIPNRRLSTSTPMWTPIGQVVLLQDQALPEWPCTFLAPWSLLKVERRLPSLSPVEKQNPNFPRIVNIRIHTDSVAGKSMATRFGTSKEDETCSASISFMQELVASGVVSIKKVSGIISNPSDVMTKYITKEAFVLHVHKRWVSHFTRMHVLFRSTPRNCFRCFRRFGELHFAGNFKWKLGQV